MSNQNLVIGSSAYFCGGEVCVGDEGACCPGECTAGIEVFPVSGGVGYPSKLLTKSVVLPNVDQDVDDTQ